MDKMGIEALEKTLKKNIGANAMISICHKLYGTQKVKCELDYIFDTERIGVKIKNVHDIFIYRDNWMNYGTKDGIFFADDMMEIRIKLDMQ